MPRKGPRTFEARARKNVEVEIRKEKQRITATEQQLKEREAKIERDARRKESNSPLRDARAGRASRAYERCRKAAWRDGVQVSQPGF